MRLFSFRALVVLTAWTSTVVLPSRAQDILPRPEQQFQGTIGRTTAETAPPQWPKPVEAPKGAPNVLVILTDDVGFGASSTFGGPIPTPTLEMLAKSGLRYNSFHTIGLCSPTRAALLTGRNHHDVAVGTTEEPVTGYEGYTGIIPKSAGTVAETLKQNGYNTAMFGKWHLTPYWEMGQAGPFDHWPTGEGFEQYYGFLTAETDQFHPALWEGTKPIEPPHDDARYILDHDLADHAIGWIRQQKTLAPNKPFFVYYAPGTAHSPHQAPKEWIANFKGRFDQGWDKVREETLARQKAQGVVPANTLLTPRPEFIPAWDSLSPDQKAVYARMMEVYAAALAYSDDQIGRVIEAIRQTGTLDNTLVIFMEGDNGASAEGGPQGQLNDVNFMNGVKENFATVRQRIDDLGSDKTNEHYPVGWAHAMDTPLQYFKQIASHLGAVRNGMVISWPARIKDKGGLRPQFHHVIDIAPTILDAAGVQAPSMLNGVPQKPLDGVSMVYTFDGANAPSTRRTQYFELVGNRGIYQDGWIAGTEPTGFPWQVIGRPPLALDAQKWDLYQLTDDYSEAVNLADKEPGRLRALQELFWAEAARNHALPIHDSSADMVRGAGIRPNPAGTRTSFTYYPGMIRIPNSVAPNTRNRSFAVAADVEVPAEGAEGVLVAHGNRFGGYSLYMLNGKLVFCYDFGDLERFSIASADTVPAGKHSLTVDFKYDGGFGKGGMAILAVDDKPVGQGRVEKTLGNMYTLDASFNVGEAAGSSVTDDYKVPFKFTGTLDRLVVTLK
ncbi:MAG: arylsulfatase family protein [Rhodospirillales bacterium]|nr:arylsulfatase family protein [Rhodospirillales bacterium]